MVFNSKIASQGLFFEKIRPQTLTGRISVKKSLVMISKKRSRACQCLHMILFDNGVSLSRRPQVLMPVMVFYRDASRAGVVTSFPAYCDVVILSRRGGKLIHRAAHPEEPVARDVKL